MSEVTRRTLLAGAAANALAADSRIIDPHVHVWKHDPAFPFAEGARVPERDAAPETLLELMKANGVARTVIIQVIHYKYDNRYLASVLKQFPAVFQGVCRVDPLDPEAPDHLSRLTAQGFRGVRLSPAGNAGGDWFRGPLMPPLWKRCQELKVPMTVLAPITRMPEVAALLEKLPGPDGGHRPHGRLPRRSAGGTGEADRPPALPQGVSSRSRTRGRFPNSRIRGWTRRSTSSGCTRPSDPSA